MRRFLAEEDDALPEVRFPDIFTRQSGVGWSPQVMIHGLGFGMKPTEAWVTYLCTNCGWFENYITQAEWLAKIKADPAKAEWQRAE